MLEQCWSGKNTWSVKQEYTLCILLACMILIHHFINFAIWTAKTKKISHAALAGQESVSARKQALLSANAKKSAAGMWASTETQCKGLATQAASPLVLSATFNSMGKKVVYIYTYWAHNPLFFGLKFNNLFFAGDPRINGVFQKNLLFWILQVFQGSNMFFCSLWGFNLLTVYRFHITWQP